MEKDRERLLETYRALELMTRGHFKNPGRRVVNEAVCEHASFLYDFCRLPLRLPLGEYIRSHSAFLRSARRFALANGEKEIWEGSYIIPRGWFILEPLEADDLPIEVFKYIHEYADPRYRIRVAIAPLRRWIVKRYVWCLTCADRCARGLDVYKVPVEVVWDETYRGLGEPWLTEEQVLALLPRQTPPEEESPPSDRRLHHLLQILPS